MESQGMKCKSNSVRYTLTFGWVLFLGLSLYAFTFLEFSDTQSMAYTDSGVLSGDGGVTFTILKNSAKHNPDFSIAPGDIAGSGFPAEYTIIKNALSTTVPPLYKEPNTTCFLTPAGHDGPESGPAYEQVQDPTTGYYPFTDFLAAFDLPNKPMAYYSFDWQNAHFIAFNTENFNAGYGKNGTDDRQYQWFIHDVQTAAARRDSGKIDWIIAFYHNPSRGYCAYEGYGDAYVQEYVDPVLYQYNVDFVFRGHEHNYTRSYPIAILDPEYGKTDKRDDARGITFITTVAGAPLRDPDYNRWWVAKGKNAWSTAFIKIEGKILTGKIFEYDQTTQAESVLDSFTVSKAADGTRHWGDAGIISKHRLGPIRSRYRTQERQGDFDLSGRSLPASARLTSAKVHIENGNKTGIGKKILEQSAK